MYVFSCVKAPDVFYLFVIFISELVAFAKNVAPIEHDYAVSKHLHMQNRSDGAIGNMAAAPASSSSANSSAVARSSVSPARTMTKTRCPPPNFAAGD